MSSSSEQGKHNRIAVVGAGIAGLVCARNLADRGYAVTLFDKGQRPGGRVATRRQGPFAFDHGAQYFTVLNDFVQSEIQSAVRDGAVAPWDNRIVSISRRRHETIRDDLRRWVGTPGMSALPRYLSADLNIHCGRAVGSVVRDGHRWKLAFEDGSKAGEAEVVVIAVPAPQAAPLLAASPAIANRVARIDMAPCWAVMLGFEKPLNLPFDGAFVDEGPLTWISRDRSKPGRSGGETLVLHASTEWSREYLELEHRAVLEDLCTAFHAATGVDVSNALFAAAHRWRYARVEAPAGDTCLFDSVLGIGTCGDWCLGSRVEAAVASGQALADRIDHDRVAASA